MMRYDEGAPVPDGGAENPPDTWRDPPRFPSHNPPADDIPDTLPSGVDPGAYATEVVMFAGCVQDPESVAVAAHHDRETMCENIAPVAMHGGDGEYYEVEARLIMASTQPSAVSLSFPLGPNDNLAIPQGHADIFDTDTAEEPASIIVACAVNDCPVDALPHECPPVACATVTVASVVNIEGYWSLEGPSVSPGTLMVPMQDGRKFDDDVSGAWHGIIHAETVRFEIGDYLFEGTVAPDRSSMSGHVIELMGYSDIGPWSAERLMG